MLCLGNCSVYTSFSSYIWSSLSSFSVRFFSVISLTTLFLFTSFARTTGLHVPVLSLVDCPRGLTLTGWGCCNRACPLLFFFFFGCSCVCFCLYGPFNCISFHTFCRQLSAFSLCSSSLNSALLVLWTLYLFMKVTLSPDLILCGWLGLKHQLTS